MLAYACGGVASLDVWIHADMPAYVVVVPLIRNNRIRMRDA